VPFPRALLLNY